ncbi:MAG: class I SAM-dependent methyltransferase [Desulfohalobiaceae bacterium]|nr:class I SAM-dependent methyltransferase [Desulfohalobiaceae bacterium]
MHRRVYKEFEEICLERSIDGSVLEVGAIPSSKSLLCMKSLENATEKVGINLNGPHEFKDLKIHKGNANSMDCFEDEGFDVVLCNALLEHDKYFWKTIGEIKRVTRPGGLIVIGTPGYKYFKAEKAKSFLRRIPLIRYLRSNQYLNLFFTATITFHIHDAPGDYYRFSPQTFKDVFFEDMDDVEVRSIMLPPRVIGVGTKRHNSKATA